MINFDEGIERPNKFGGSEKKTTLLLNDKIYMIKLPDPVKNIKIREMMSYKNNRSFRSDYFFAYLLEILRMLFPINVIIRPQRLSNFRHIIPCVAVTVIHFGLDAPENSP